MKTQALFLLKCGVTALFLLLASVMMGLVGVLTLFQLRGFYADCLLRVVGLAILWIWQVQVKLHGSLASTPHRQVVYIANHTSTLDIFVLITLALPRTRFFLSGFLRKTFVIGVIGYLIRVFWTVPQSFPEKRRQIFQAAEKTLRKSGDSVFLSPEGERVTSGAIGPFNKGAFHLASALAVPIVPIYIAIPKRIDPGKGLHALPGCVEVFVGSEISTTHWKLSELIENKEAIRKMYVDWQLSPLVAQARMKE